MAGQEEISNHRLTLATFFLSASVLMFELALIRIFSVVAPSHVAFLGIAVALYGLAIGAVTVYKLPSYFSDKNGGEILGKFIGWYGASLILFPVLFLIPFYFLKTDAPAGSFSFSIGHLIVVGIAFFIASAPFILANIFLSFLFKKKTDIVGKLYFADLVGAAFGVVIGILLMNLLSGLNVALAAALFGLIAATFVAPFKLKPLTNIAAMILIAVAFLFWNQSAGLAKIRVSKRGVEQNIIFEKWNSFSRITLEGVRLFQSFPSSAPKLESPLFEVQGIRIDGDAYTPVLRFNGDFNTVAFLASDLSSAAYHLAEPRGKTLIIGPGGGKDVLTALLFGYQVRGVEINPIIVSDLMNKKLKDFSGNLYQRPDVEIITAEGRSFLTKDLSQYDVINLSLVDTWASTIAGNLFIVESYLYTVEAFEEYLEHLTDNGLLTVSRWDFDGMRLLSLYLESAKKLGITEPEKNIAVLSNGVSGPTQLNNYLFKKQPFSKEELAKTEAFAKTTGAKILYLPGQNLRTEHEAFLKNDRQVAALSLGRNLKPVHDNDPFFFFISPVRQIFNLAGKNNAGVDGGLASAFGVVFLYSTICIIAPSLGFPNQKGQLQKSKKVALFSLAYFACLGLAFMLVELTIIQKFILYLEHPIYSYSIMLASLLLFAGLGSFASQKFNELSLATYIKISAIIFLLIVISIPISSWLINSTAQLPLIIKVFVAGLTVLPVAFPMGMLLPLGIKALGSAGFSSIIPWGWAINGAFSVIASALAILFAVSWGFTVSLIIAAGIYLFTPLFLTPLLTITTKEEIKSD